MDWLIQLRDYQTGIGALIGFMGVIVTLVVNGILARRQSERAAKLAQRQATDQIARERTVLRTALQAETEVVIGYLDFDLENMKKAKETYSSYDLRMDYPTTVHDRHIDRLGLLTLEQAKRVAMANAHLHAAPSEIRWLKRSTQEHEGHIRGEHQYIISIPASILEDAIDAWRTLRDVIEHELKELQKPDE